MSTLYWWLPTALHSDLAKTEVSVYVFLVLKARACKLAAGANGDWEDRHAVPPGGVRSTGYHGSVCW